jgi:hypothetical protein
MRQAQYARRIRAEFIRDPLRQAEACTLDGTGAALDRRHWDGRTGVSCGKQWTKIKAACVKFQAYGEGIRLMELAGAPTMEDIVRCAFALYKLGAGVTSRLYDVIRAKSYPVGKEFPYMSYGFLSRMTALLECGAGEPDACLAVDEEEGVANCQNEDTEAHGTGSPRGGSTMGSAPSVPQHIAQDDADGDRRRCTTAHISRRCRPSG